VSGAAPDPGIPDDEILDRPRAYVRLTAETLATLPALAKAVEAFEPVPGPAGESVARWLREQALREPQEATIRARLSYGRVTGVYALCAAQVALAEDARAELGGLHYRTQPAVLLAQFARAADAEGTGGELLEHAVGATRRALWWIGATVLVVDPFDEATDGYWREHWGLKPSEQRVPGNRSLRRLWTAIPR
jgi:hypothetical protein